MFGAAARPRVGAAARPRVGAAGLLCAGIAGLLGLAGCGLETIPYLYPPGTPILATSTTPQFELRYGTANNQPEFRGFEVYYKFTNDGSKENTNITTVTALATAGYRPVQGNLDTPTNHIRPLVSVLLGDRGIDFRSIVDFSGVGVASPSTAATAWYDYDGAASGKAEVLIFRNVDDGSGGLKQFSVDQLQVGDPDLSSVILPGHLDIVLYGLSFGWQDISTPLYSDAVYLGYIPIMP